MGTKKIDKTADPVGRESESLELPPELSAWEATLAAAKPTSDSAARERTKAHALLETCRRAAPEKADLIEAILEAGEQRMSRSLRQYVRSERFRAGTVGVVIGLLLGAILNVFGMVFLFLLLKIL